ncbi:putative cyclin-dependent kinase F-2 [Eutrema salsugineum]|uniref:putative cyclin-dependent kinase F-2 n=1 Tax=Eutrema salsugineum TaxID=72664 RepID=UPI000CECF7C7|nr:putative cyclin-dependent kinase F-2 [Eutrema salsugineum]
MEQICESRDPWIVDDSSLRQACVLGRGSFGSVTLIGDPQLRAYAKKTCPINLFSNLEKELDIMLRFHSHPCIVQAKSPFVHLENNTRNCYIYMEYANKRTLHKMISEFRGKPLPEYMIQREARMILQGLEALHAKDYVHCDLKPGNIILFHSTTFGEPFDF